MILLSLTMVILILLFFLFLYFMVNAICKSKLKLRYKIIISLCLISVLYLSYTKTRYRYLYPSIHFLFQPDDYCDPLITDEFAFHIKGYCKTYLLPYKYPQIHAVKVLPVEIELSKFHRSKGILQAQFFYKDRLLFEKVITSLNENRYVMEFPMPLNNKYKKNIQLKLTVVEPFKEFDKPLPIETGVISN